MTPKTLRYLYPGRTSPILSARRHRVKPKAGLSAIAALAVANLLSCAAPIAQADTVGDHLWIWGHPAGSYNDGFLRPLKLVSTIEPVAAAEHMGLKNLIFVG